LFVHPAVEDGLIFGKGWNEGKAERWRLEHAGVRAGGRREGGRTEGWREGQREGRRDGETEGPEEGEKKLKRRRRVRYLSGPN
jgi:hypothetical protein